jgi:hypothetical protein
MPSRAFASISTAVVGLALLSGACRTSTPAEADDDLDAPAAEGLFDPRLNDPLAVQICSTSFAREVHGVVRHANRAPSPVRYANATGDWANAWARQRWLHQSQGTRILPLSWILALDGADGTPFLADGALAKHGYLPDHDRRCNPLELPVGMAVDGSFRGEARGGSLVSEPAFVGYSCASCHTTPIRIGRDEFRILGGAGLVDQSGFNAALGRALARAATADGQAFVARIVQIQTVLYGAAETPAAIGRALEATLAAARPTEVFGPGLLDALGNGGNFMFDRYLERFHGQREMAAANRVSLDAPVAMPPIYGAPAFDWAYYGHSFRSPFTRALAETVAVSAPTALVPPAAGRPWATTVNARGLVWMEGMLRKLEAPRFPDRAPDARRHPIGETYGKLRKLGEALYWDPQIGCARCHGPRNDAQPGAPLRRTWRRGEEFRLNTVPIGVIGTDPTNVLRFAQRTIRLPEDVLAGLGRTSPLGTGSLLDEGRSEARVVVALDALMTGVAKDLFRREGWGSYPDATLGLGREATLGRTVCDGHAKGAACAEIRPWIAAGGPHDSVIFAPDGGFDAHDPRCRGLSASDCRALRDRTGWLVYRARPLAGIWASAPFLHDNSVASLCALLGNDRLGDPRFVRRPFRVGGAGFDPECVGFREDEGTATFEPRGRGAANGGHVYGAGYRGRPEAGIVGPALTKTQIFGLIEYLKDPDFEI